MSLETLSPSAKAPISRFRRIPTARKVTIVAVAMILIQTVLRGWLTGHSWFFSDDFLFLGDIGHGDDNLAWYFRFHYSHVMPLSFVLVKIVAWFGAFNWAAAATQIIVMQLIASLSCWWMLRTLFGSRMGILPLLAFFLFSPMTLAPNLWWAVAINQLPYLVAFFGAVGCHVLYLRSRRTKYAWLATAFLVLGYLTYTKTMLLPIVLVLVTLLYFAAGGPLRRLGFAIRRFWPAWLMYGIVSAMYLVFYIMRAPSSPVGKIDGKFIHLSITTVLETIVPAMFGGPLRWGYGGDVVLFASPTDIVVVISWILLAALFAHALLTRTRTLRALTIPAIYLIISLILIRLSRDYLIVSFGPDFMAHHVRYLTDFAAVIVLTVGLMAMPLIGSVESSERRKIQFSRIQVSPLVIGVLAVAILVGYSVSSLQFSRPWLSASPAFVQRAFFQNALSEIEVKPHLFAENALPAVFITPLLYPHNMPSHAFSPVLSSHSTTEIGNGLFVFRDDGSIAPAELDGPIRTDAAKSEKCPFEVKGKERKIPFAPVFNYPFWMAIDYDSNTEAEIPLDYGIYRKTVPIENGSHTLFLPTTGSYDSITLRPLVGQRICVKSVRVGQLAPRAPS